MLGIILEIYMTIKRDILKRKHVIKKFERGWVITKLGDLSFQGCIKDFMELKGILMPVGPSQFKISFGLLNLGLQIFPQIHRGFDRRPFLEDLLCGLVIVPKIRFEGFFFDLLQAGNFCIYVKDDLGGFLNGYPNALIGPSRKVLALLGCWQNAWTKKVPR
jgi:hypothetical protein